MKNNLLTICYGILLVMIFFTKVKAQLPENVLVGYHENWNSLKLSQIHTNYNVICLAFALPVNAPAIGHDIRYTIPAGYTGTAVQKKEAFLADIDALHAAGKIVLLSIGGATGPIRLNTSSERDVFVNSVNSILEEYDYKIDGIDLDLESSSMAFGSNWTITTPAIGQLHLIKAVKSIMQNYKSQTGKKIILTAAPEVVYLMGGLSQWQVQNVNGGAFLPILEALKNELDLLHMQLYNAGGSTGGMFAWNGSLYYDNGTADFALAMNESIVKGFTCVDGKGTFTGFPPEKLAFGFPATSSASTAGTGYVNPTEICTAAKYFKGEISKPSGISYTMTTVYPNLKGLMTWSINEDAKSSNGAWNFANNYTCAFPATVTNLYSKNNDSLSFSVYPNPVSDNSTLTIQIEKATPLTISIADLAGTIVYSSKLHQLLKTGKNEIEIPQNLPAGIYCVQLVTIEEDTNFHFVKID